MKKRTIFAVTMSLCLTLMTASYSFGVSSEDVFIAQNAIKNIEIVKVAESFETSEQLSNVGGVSYKNAIKIGGENYNLYPTFNNIQEAIGNINNQCNSILSEMKALYELEDFADTTAKSYWESIPIYLEKINGMLSEGMISDEIYAEKVNQINKFESFWDIYENDDANEEIIEIVHKLVEPQKKPIV